MGPQGPPGAQGYSGAEVGITASLHVCILSLIRLVNRATFQVNTEVPHHRRLPLWDNKTI